MSWPPLTTVLLPATWLRRDSTKTAANVGSTHPLNDCVQVTKKHLVNGYWKVPVLGLLSGDCVRQRLTRLRMSALYPVTAAYCPAVILRTRAACSQVHRPL